MKVEGDRGGSGGNEELTAVELGEVGWKREEDVVKGMGSFVRERKKE